MGLEKSDVVRPEVGDERCIRSEAGLGCPHRIGSPRPAALAAKPALAA